MSDYGGRSEGKRRPQVDVGDVDKRYKLHHGDARGHGSYRHTRSRSGEQHEDQYGETERDRDQARDRDRNMDRGRDRDRHRERDYLDVGEYDDGPSTSSSSSRRYDPYSNTSANCS